MEQKRVLITGASGFVGKLLLPILSAREDVDSIVNVDVMPPADGLPKVSWVERSVTEDLVPVFEDGPGVDIAIHMAWSVTPMRDARAQRALCIGGTQRFLAGCARGGVKQILFVSSASAYGAAPDNACPLDEGVPLRAAHYQYAREKREAEGLFERYQKEHPEALIQVVRPVIVGGPGVSNFIFRAIEKPLTLRLTGLSPQVQLVHVEDCARAIAHILSSKAPGAFNIAAADTLILSEVHRLIGARAIPMPYSLARAIVGLAWHLRLTFIAEAPGSFLSFLAYPWVVSNRRLTQDLGFSFRHTSRETFSAFLAAREPHRRAKAKGATAF